MSVDPLIVELRKIRRDSEVSQETVGIAVCRRPCQMSQYESGRSRPGLNILHKWAEALGYELVLQRKVTP